MSTRLFSDDVLFLQRFLKSAGFYQGGLDGDWGALTDGAVRTFEEVSEGIAHALGRFDGRSERAIATLHPEAQRKARVFLRTLLEADIQARVISGTRSYAEQDALYRQGRWGNPGPVVTRARGGQSNHNFGIAWDIGIFEGGRYLAESPLYETAATVGLVPGLAWGGHWRSFPDRPHYELATVVSSAAHVRLSFEAGTAFV